MKKITKQNFANTTDEVELEIITSEILDLKLNMVENSIALGVKLKQVKETLKHGEWILFLEHKVDVGVRTAQKFMRIATEFANTKSLSHFGTEKLYILLELTKIEREEFIVKNQIEVMSARELSEKIKAIKYNKRKNHRAAKELEIIEVKKTKEIIKDNTDEKIKMNKIAINTKKILKKATDLKEEIEIRTGGFYSSNEDIEDVNCDYRGGILAQLYVQGEITEDELVETIKVYNIDLDINFKNMSDGTAKINYTNNINNTYNRYNLNTDINYLAITNSELSYKNVIEFAFEKKEKDRLECMEYSKKDIFIRDNITIAKGYYDGLEFLCVFKDRETLAHYKINISNKLEKVSELFCFYNIDSTYISLVEQFIKKMKVDKLEKQKKDFERIKGLAKFKNEIKKDLDVYTIIFKDNLCVNSGDDLYISLLKLLENIEKKLWNQFKKVIVAQNLNNSLILY